VEKPSSSPGIGPAGRHPRIVPVQAGELQRELHRHLTGRPLARVVQAEDEEGGPAVVGGVDVRRQLDALDRSSLDRGAGGHRPRQAGVLGDDPLELVAVLGRRAVGRLAARERARRRRQRPRIRRPQVGHPDVRREARRQQPRPLGRRVQHHVGGPRGHVVRHVEPQRLEPVQRRAPAERHAHELGWE
jgi:hypothetical protein